MKSSGPELLPLLKQYFGFTSFRPLQEEIIRDSLAGKDVFALLPTGGGKSLCFQLPALARDGLTVVVSPLIALMKDQVDALQAGGVPATFLNSSLAADESRKRLRGLHSGEFRLLYVAPERLMLSGFLADLQRWNVKLIAVDEAHCISEWGHDFRPEYRQLAQLREHVPERPVHGAHRNGDGTRARRHRYAFEIARAALLRCELQSSESDLPGHREEQALRPVAGVSPRTAEGRRHRVLPVAQNRRAHGGESGRGWRARRARITPG